MERKNHYLNDLIDANFQGVNRFFLLSFENNADRKAGTGYFLPKLEIKDCNVMIDGQNFFNQPAKNDLRTYDNTQKLKLVKETDCLLD